MLSAFIIGFGYQTSSKILQLSNAVENLQNNLHIPLPFQQEKNEVGHLSHILEYQRQQALLAQSAHVSEIQIAPPKESYTPPSTSNDTLEKIDHFKHQTKNVCDTLNQLASSIKIRTTEINNHTNNAYNTVASAAEKAEESNSSVQTVVSAANELSGSIEDIRKHVSQSAQVAKQAAKAAEETDTRVNGLADAASKINDVVQLIQDIANQTHLLALNATIEAARAGEAGKGFAVVASEVKNLANQTAKATDDISNQIEHIQAATRDTVTSIRSISTIIHEVNDVSDAIALAIEQQGRSAHNISQNIHQALMGTQHVSQRIASVNAAAKEASETSVDMTKIVDTLLRHTESLQKSVQTLSVH